MHGDTFDLVAVERSDITMKGASALVWGFRRQNDQFVARSPWERGTLCVTMNTVHTLIPLSQDEEKRKPLLRGMVDVAALLVLIPACLTLVRSAPAGSVTIAALVYSIGVLSMVGASALYHAPRWPETSLRWLQKVDFAAIYLVIAGTYTPVCLLVLGEPGKLMLVATWIIASLGVLKAFLWSHAPRWLRAGIYVAFGWMVVPYLGVLWAMAGAAFVALIGIGGLLYSLSALVYVKRWGNFHPKVWGYHESMHALVISAVGCHFVAMWTLLVAA